MAAAGPASTADTALRAEAAGPTVVARGLEKRFGDLTAVAGVDFEIAPGECFGFLGPNGAGKTTTMRMISCAVPVSGGALTVLGLDVRARPREVKRHLGVVPQENNLDEDLTVRENLLLYGTYFDLPRAEAAARADRLIDFVQLADKASAKVEALSGGMKRRLLIARALVSEPRLVILDEPTTGLDPQSRHHVWDRLEALKAERRTLILTTHYMDEAEVLCDRLVVMEQGRFIAEGRPRQLILDHVGRDVVEVAGPEAVRRRILGRYQDKVAGSETVREKLYLYTGDADALLHALTGGGFEGITLYARRATLEDVFLKLTGRGLRE